MNCMRSVEDDTLDVNSDDILVLKNCGPRGYPGMAEVGQHAAPREARAPGGDRHGAHFRCAHERHRLRHSRAARSARSRGGRKPGAWCKNGDIIELDVERRRLHLEVSDEELTRRRASWKAPAAPMSRGYTKLYFDHVQQANHGADLDFLVGGSGSAIPKDNH